jgi:hypothetical protein
MGSRNTTRLKSAEYTRFQTRDHEGPHIHAESHLSVILSHTFRKSERRKFQKHQHMHLLRSKKPQNSPLFYI